MLTDSEANLVLRKLTNRLSYANVMATIAVFVALGGSGYAATKINGKNIKNKSIAGKKLKNRTITRTKVKRNTLGGAEIAESRLGLVGSAETAEVATRAESALSADKADNAGNAGLLDGVDSSAFARRSDGVGFLVPPSGWGGSGFTSIALATGQTTFTKNATATNERMTLPLSYPTDSNGRALRITAIRICRITTNATIKQYNLSIGSGSSFASDAGGVTVNLSGSGCDVVDVADINPQGGPFDASGPVTADFGVTADYGGGGGSVTLGAAQLTLAPG